LYEQIKDILTVNSSKWHYLLNIMCSLTKKITVRDILFSIYPSLAGVFKVTNVTKSYKIRIYEEKTMLQ